MDEKKKVKLEGVALGMAETYLAAIGRLEADINKKMSELTDLLGRILGADFKNNWGLTVAPDGLYLFNRRVYFTDNDGSLHEIVSNPIMGVDTPPPDPEEDNTLLFEI